MKDKIKDLNIEQLFHLVGLATGGHFDSSWSYGKKEVETGGYGKRRRVIWIMELEGREEYHAFEITNESGCWAWHCESSMKKSDYDKGGYWSSARLINTLNPVGIVDYLRKEGFTIN